MTRIERIYADFIVNYLFCFARENPLKSDLIRVPLSLMFDYYCLFPACPAEELKL
jgi:hypothetical protein